MSVNFHESSYEEGVMICDECGEQIDSDHYNDMVAHDGEHENERARIAALPATVILENEKIYSVLQKRTDGVYVVAASTLSYDTAATIAAALA